MLEWAPLQKSEYVNYCTSSYFRNVLFGREEAGVFLPSVDVWFSVYNLAFINLQERVRRANTVCVFVCVCMCAIMFVCFSVYVCGVCYNCISVWYMCGSFSFVCKWGWGGRYMCIFMFWALLFVTMSSGEKCATREPPATSTDTSSSQISKMPRLLYLL